jgi:hypothetical protein
MDFSLLPDVDKFSLEALHQPFSQFVNAKF